MELNYIVGSRFAPGTMVFNRVTLFPFAVMGPLYCTAHGPCWYVMHTATWLSEEVSFAS
jgi:hypothetical protein